MKNVKVYLTAAFLFIGLLSSAFTQVQILQSDPAASENIPEQYRALYKELDSSLQKASQIYPFYKNDNHPLIAPNLAMAASFYSPTFSDSLRWKNILSTLDAFRDMKANAVMVQIAAPDLAWGDSLSLIEFYRRLAGEIHARKMKLYIEHFVNIPFKPNEPSGKLKNKPVQQHTELKNDPEGRKEFLKILELEVTMIYREIKPDYLSLLTEPGAAIVQSLHFSFKGNELAFWTGDVASRLKASAASPQTLLGAGGVSYEPYGFFLGFAQQKGLDFIDFHFYMLNLMGEDQLQKMSNLIHKIREIRPAMNITIGETWLFKNGKESQDASYKDIFSRDNFSFWSPLDQKFITLLMGLAQKENISVIAPFYSQYLFSYYTYGSDEANNLPKWPKSVVKSWNKAFEAIHENKISETGKALRMLLEQSSN